jgi:uncharacterized protein YhaN
MRILRLRLHDVQRHEDLDLRFAPGLTIVRGPNESGKSTVQRALELALFRRCTATGRDIDGMLRWGAPDDACPAVELEFDVDGKRGRLEKRFAGGKGTVRLEYDGQVTTDPAAADRLLAEITGLPSEKFFRSTASVHHQELDDLDRDESTLRDRLQVAMAGSDQGTSVAKKRLAEAMRRLTTEGPKNPGVLRRLRDEASRLGNELREGEAALSRLEADQAALSDARGRLAAAETRLAQEREALETAERAAKLLREREEAQRRYDRLKRAAEIRAELSRLGESHPSSVPLTTLRPAVEQLREAERQISEMRAELAQDADVEFEVHELPPAWRRWAAVGGVLTIVALVVAVLAVNAGQQYAPLALVPLGAAVIVTFIAVRRRRRAAEITQRHLLPEGQLSRRLRGRSGVADRLALREREHADLLSLISLPDTPAAEALLSAEQEHVSAIEQLHAEERGLFGDERPEGDLAVQRDAAAAAIEQLGHALAGMGEVGADPVAARERHRTALAAATTEQRTAIGQEGAARGRLDANPVDAELVASTAERLAETQDRLSATERRLRIYRTTFEALESAEKGTMKKAARYLEEEMGPGVARVTSDRYDRVKVDESSLAFSVWSPERGDWIDVRELSQGTLDQFYLVARLGLVRQLTHGRKPPLLLDDPFLTFDDQRAAAAVLLLKDITADHQVIYLTTSDRYDAVADAVIALARPPVPTTTS